MQCYSIVAGWCSYDLSRYNLQVGAGIVIGERVVMQVVAVYNIGVMQLIL